ncbi:hypothetical protein PSTT_10431 [Puccinia striiformis]|uniref:Uncharacterized protein n=1 Tax=Puccinia striiformis TaxID=27350 RepID=A0A2S4V4H3_9BASI|nr:hypothetical protein PSTT_10431 [Puccinia striiformis]
MCQSWLGYKDTCLNRRSVHSPSSIEHLSHIPSEPNLSTTSLSFSMRFAAAIAIALSFTSVSAQLPALGGFGGPAFPGSAPAQFPGLGGFDGPSCSNQNGLINAAVLTETHCHGSGGGTGPMRCGNQGGDPSGGGLLGGLLGPGNALLNVNALSTVDCYN